MRQFVAFWLVEMKQQSYEKVAKYMETTPEAVRKLVQRCRKRKGFEEFQKKSVPRQKTVTYCKSMDYHVKHLF